ncbi:hypothetical protein [Penaeicola halotolerans]|uniref:hypothetical protein n=1 Tax=Penaeicola halotolerans TaxID=2793196 RepID=UPI001CF8827D|nr:hypothetical protein [Penaeicola halotolerans]
MKTPPESFLIFREELKKAELEKKRLKEEYEQKIAQMNQELLRLQEQISAQQDMMKTTIQYASKIEEEMKNLNHKMEDDKNKGRKTFH